MVNDGNMVNKKKMVKEKLFNNNNDNNIKNHTGSNCKKETYKQYS